MVEALRDTPVLVVDCQSTGSTPAQGHLLELGWARYAAAQPPPAPGAVEARLVALPEGARLPRVVAELTGLAPADLEGAEAPEAAWTALRAASAGRAVIHFAPYEVRWLTHLSAEFSGAEALPWSIVCTHAIAKHLLPALPRRGLRALAGYFGYPAGQLRRSADHVAATCFVWQHTVAALAGRGIETWADLDELLATPAPKKPKARRYPMPKKVRLALPDVPGVYRFKRTNGDILYVGKATSLKKRVNSHFTKQAGLSDRQLELLSQARDLEYEETTTPLEAALLETDEIKTLAPPYNVALLEERRDVAFASRDLAETAPAPDAAHPIGPLSSRFAVAAVPTVRDLLAAGADVDEASLPRFTSARALGILPVSAPGAAVFLEGLAELRRRHGLAGPVSVAELLALGRHVLRLGLPSQRPERPDETEVVWDPDRVADHLEDALARVPPQLARARWLRRLTAATVGFVEPGAGAMRVLSIAGGAIVDRADAEPSAALPPPPSRGESAFDIGQYDRLRVLTTELKRVVRDGGQVALHFGGRAPLTGDAAARALLGC